MSRQIPIFAAEHKLLLATILFAFCLSFSSTCLLAVENYNAQIAKAETEKRWLAEGKDISDFAICNFGVTYPECWSRFFSFVFLPFCYFLARPKKPFYLLSSGVLLLFPFVNFLSWAAKTERLAFYRELQIASWTDKFLYQSNSFDLLLFYLIPILLVWHGLLLLRALLVWTTQNTNLA